MQNLKYNSGIFKLNGTEINNSDIFKQNKDTSFVHTEIIVQQQKQMEKQLKIISRQKGDLIQQQNSIESQKKDLEEQKIIQLNQLTKIKLANNSIAKKIMELDSQKIEIDKQNYLIKTQKQNIVARNEILEQQKREIERQKDRIEIQSEILTRQGISIAVQKSIVFIISFALIFFIFLFIYIYKNYRQKNRVNEILEFQNHQIIAQKVELETNARHMEAVNEELEKLSLVASKTDNAITLIDSNGQLIWINDAFTRLYGYTLKELIELKGNNIFVISTNLDIKEYFFHSINKRESVHYESKAQNRDGHTFYIRTTLSPIIDKDGLVSRLVAIDTDVSDKHKAEQEIYSQAFELREINDMLMDQKELLQAKNENINASIRSAEIIQSTILPHISELNEKFTSFVLYRPKEIVSGDFYWYGKYMDKANDKEYYFYAAVDCTGHGVPGALMSLIGSRLLNEVLYIDKIIEPKDILTNLNSKFERALKQDLNDNRDGMDIALLRLDYSENEKNVSAVYCGAKRNLFIALPNENVLSVVPGNRKKIGGPRTRNIEEFTQEELVFEKDTIFYLTTDGYIDQSNAARKRYGTKRLLQKLAEIKDLPMVSQNKELNTNLDIFMSHTDQRDDITILAIKII
jgi:PAS domain S-box-containing protein